MKIQLAVWFCALGSSVVLAENPIEYNALNTLGTEKTPIVLDLTKGSEVVSGDLEPGTVYVKIINMLPSIRESYEVKLAESKLSRAAFTKPGAVPRPVETKDKSTTPVSPLCDSLKKKADKVWRAKEETSEFAKDVVELNRLLESGDVKNCPDRENAKKILNSTINFVKADLRDSSELTVSVTRPGKSGNLASASFKSEPKQWMVQAGFTFAGNGDELYYSRKEGDDYIITKQNGGSDLKYAATVMFTYPAWSHSNWLKYGPMAGIGVAANSPLVMAGMGFVFADNFAIGLGAVVMEFERLSGSYEKGQNIGTSPIDSSALSTDEYDVTWGITLGYRFN